MSTRATGRHRASARPTTPLTVLVDVVSSNATTMTRRSAVVAASSGLVVTMGLPAATAAPLAEGTTSSSSETTDPAADVQAPAADAVEASAEAAAPVSVAADAAVTFTGTALTSATPPPPPPPPPPVEEAEESEPRGEDRPERASRSDRDSGAEKSEASTRPSASEAGGSVLAIAERYVGTMYVYGGTTPAGFDCSGFTQYVYAQVGIDLPRTSGAQANAGRRVSASEARPGDLVYTPGHIGIYAGGNMMYDSPRSGKAVAKREMWFTPTFIRVG